MLRRRTAGLPHVFLLFCISSNACMLCYSGSARDLLGFVMSSSLLGVRQRNDTQRGYVADYKSAK